MNTRTPLALAMAALTLAPLVGRAQQDGQIAPAGADALK